MRILIGTLALVWLAGCTTTQTTYEQAKSVEKPRVLANDQPLAIPAGELLVTRDSGALGSACYLGIYVNGTLSARIGPGERVRFIVPAGENLIGSGSDPRGNGLCAIEGMSVREVSTTLKVGEIKRFRVSGDMNTGFSLSPTSF